MPKTKVVVFTTNNTRILINPDPSLYTDIVDAVVNPDLSALRGIPPHFWKLVDGKVVEMTRPEKKARLREHARLGVYNHITNLPTHKRSFLYKHKYNIVSFLLGAAMGALILWRM